MRRSWLLFFAPVTLLLLIGMGLQIYLSHIRKDKISHIRARALQRKEPVLPAFSAQQILTDQLRWEKEDVLLPLTGPSHTWTVFCREEDGFLEYRSDRHGFHNDDKIWDEPVWDSVFLGDSFIQGACVPEEDNLVNGFKSQLGLSSVANLGSYGNGPLAQLGSLIEYAKRKKPKVVFWSYVANDLFLDFQLEATNPVLHSYLQGDSQNLQARKKEFEQKLSDRLLEALEIEARRKKERPFSSLQLVFDFLWSQVQRHSRSAPRTRLELDFKHISDIDWPLYQQTLKKAVELTHSWGGTFVFVIIPHSEMVLADSQPQVLQLKRKLKSILSPWQVQIVDLHENLQKEAAPLENYVPLGSSYGHFTKVGYRKAAQILAEKFRSESGSEGHHSSPPRIEN